MESERERMLDKWERAVKSNPAGAYRAGPPNWLVVEEKESGETMLAAADRVKAQYFPMGEPC